MYWVTVLTISYEANYTDIDPIFFLLVRRARYKTMSNNNLLPSLYQHDRTLFTATALFINYIYINRPIGSSCI